MREIQRLQKGLGCALGMDPEKGRIVHTHIKATKTKGNLNYVSVKTDVEPRSLETYKAVK